MNNPLFSILICTLSKRETLFNGLSLNLRLQCLDFKDENIEILVDSSDVDSIGEKRNRLLEKAQGKYLCFVDDDDSVSENYIKLLIEAAKSGQDCASLKGIYSVDGVEDGVFEHSILYDKWETTTDTIKYLRHPNHLNLIRSDIAKQFKFPEKNFGEDYEWSLMLHKAKVLKTEHYISEILYFYRFLSNK